MRSDKILLIYKKSAYKIYLQQIKNTERLKSDPILLSKIDHSIDAHNEHYETLKYVEYVLHELKIPYTKRLRKQPVDFKKYNLVLTVGGDGTFLETARFLTNQYILGINSAPRYSVGKLCAGNKNNIKKYLKNILSNNFKTNYLERLRVQLIHSHVVADCLNEILVCDANPAIMSRYHLTINNKSEEQYGSGLWISTPSGSTGASKSAGGKILKTNDKILQYIPRELYESLHKKYQLKGGLITLNDKMSIVSFMKNGMIYIDGNHSRLPFKYGSQIAIKLSPIALKTFKFYS